MVHTNLTSISVEQAMWQVRFAVCIHTVNKNRWIKIMKCSSENRHRFKQNVRKCAYI